MRSTANRYVPCTSCGKPAKLVLGSDFSARPSIADKRFWRCEACDVHVGAHAHGGPMGPLADRLTRSKRRELHRRFDSLWNYSGNGKVRTKRRRRLYDKLARELGIDAYRCHIGQMDSETLARALEVVKRWKRERAL